MELEAIKAVRRQADRLRLPRKERSTGQDVIMKYILLTHLEHNFGKLVTPMEFDLGSFDVSRLLYNLAAYYPKYIKGDDQGYQLKKEDIGEVYHTMFRPYIHWDNQPNEGFPS